MIWARGLSGSIGESPFGDAVADSDATEGEGGRASLTEVGSDAARISQGGLGGGRKSPLW